MSQLAELLGLETTGSAIEKWEKDQNKATKEHRDRILDFLGFDPTKPNPTGSQLKSTVGM